MAPTSIEVTVDRDEYSKYEDTRSLITATVVCAGGTPYASTDVVIVELRKARRDRDVAVSTQEIVLTASSGVDTQVVTFDLTDILDEDDYSAVRHGQYFVYAYYEDDPVTVAGSSDDFYVSIVTVDRLKSTYLYGLPLGATLSRNVRVQPTNVTGVTVVHMSEEHPVGFYPLSFGVSDAGVRTLSWAGGPSVVISAPGKYLLKMGSAIGSNSPLAKLQLSQSPTVNFIEVVVSSLLALPAASIADELLIEKRTLDDSTLRDFIIQATDWLEQIALQVYLEPTRVVTDLDTDVDHDVRTQALTFFRGSSAWMNIQTPFKNILRVNDLEGHIATMEVLDIDLDWVQNSGPGGLLQLIPFNSSVPFSALGLLWIGTLSSPTEIPNFWHYDLLVGLAKAPPNLQELIAKKAAIEALVLLGQALRPGVGSMSLGRDGVSQSISYTSQAQYGAYTGTITLYKEWIEKELKMYRGKYIGPGMVVV